MLKKILGEHFNAFISRHYLKYPMALPQIVTPCLSLLDRSRFLKLAQQVPNIDVLVVKNGKLLDKTSPQTELELAAMRQEGQSLVLRGVERFDAGLKSLSQQLAQELKAQVAIQIYWTPTGYFGFDWHYDAEEVFILQIEGVKHYYLRPNTVNPQPLLESFPKDMGFEYEKSPVIVAPLIPGDWLYIPAGWWHMAKASQEALSISIGAMPLTLIDFVDSLRDHLLSSASGRARLPPRDPSLMLGELREIFHCFIEDRGSTILKELGY